MDSLPAAPMPPQQNTNLAVEVTGAGKLAYASIHNKIPKKVIHRPREFPTPHVLIRCCLPQLGSWETHIARGANAPTQPSHVHAATTPVLQYTDMIMILTASAACARLIVNVIIRQRPLTESYSNTFSQCSSTLYPWSSPDFTIPAIHSTLCLKSFCFSARLRDSLCKPVQQSLRVAQLVERETVRVAFVS